MLRFLRFSIIIKAQKKSENGGVVMNRFEIRWVSCVPIYMENIFQFYSGKMKILPLRA